MNDNSNFHYMVQKRIPNNFKRGWEEIKKRRRGIYDENCQEKTSIDPRVNVYLHTKE